MKNKYLIVLLSFTTSIMPLVSHAVESNEYEFWQGLNTYRNGAAYSDDDITCYAPCENIQNEKNNIFWNSTTIGKEESQYVLKKSKFTRKASTFLLQSTYGPTSKSIHDLSNAIEAEGYKSAVNRWIDEQIDLAPQSYLRKLAGDGSAFLAYTGWLKQSLIAPDQLRQRMAFALNHIIPVNQQGPLVWKPDLVVEHYDILAKNAFGNFRDLLTDITFHLGMGTYLGNIGNSDSRTNGGVPNENYARELLQLFTLGTDLLNTNGSLYKLNGKPVPTYSENDVAALARALSGLKPSSSTPMIMPNGMLFSGLLMNNDNHFKGEKIIFSGTKNEVIINSADGEDEIHQALDAIFNHPNLAPHLSRRLIQNFVKSNPSPQYIRRVSMVFNDNGFGQRGDMRAVIKAIFLDYEADMSRRVPGKVREPIIRYTNVVRAFETDPVNPLNRMSIQQPLAAPSVFSFFQSDDSPPNLMSDGLYAPELKLAGDQELAIINNIFFADILDKSEASQSISNYHSVFMRKNIISLDKEIESAKNPRMLVNRYLLLLTGGRMDKIRADEIIKRVSSIVNIDSSVIDPDTAAKRARIALYMVATSAEQATQ